MKRTLNVGLIGFGMIGKAHAFAYATTPYYAPGLHVVGKVVAVATRSMSTATRAQEMLGCEIATDDWRRVVEDPAIDVVHICTPNGDHLAPLLAAIRLGKHIYCEKPIVGDAEEAAALREALEEKGSDGAPKYRGTNQVAFHLRGFAAVRRAKELIDEGRLGRVLQYRASYLQSSMLDPDAPFRWKNGPSGGAALDLASHLFDLVDFLVGLPKTVSAQSSVVATSRPIRAIRANEDCAAVPRRDVQAEDSIVALTRGLLDPTSVAEGDPKSPNALTGVVEASKISCGAADDMTIEVRGERGAVKFDLANPGVLEFFDGERPCGVYGGEAGWLRIESGARYPAPESEFPSAKATVGWIRAHVASLAAFYRAIEDGRAYGADFAQALRVQDALDAAKRSAAAMEWTELRATARG